MASNSTLSKSSFNQKTKSIRSSVFATLLVFLLSGLQLLAQSGTFVTGKVTDAETGKPLVGASVAILDIRVGGVTDKEGTFKFRAPEGKYTIEVKYVGYDAVTRAITIKAGETTTVNFKLSQGSIKTNEIVVVGLSGEVDKNQLGNTIATVGSEAVNNVVSSSAIDALSGRVLGAEVTRNSGTPGAGTYITLRGRKTLEGSSEPLYIVDGIVIDNSSLYDPSGRVQLSNRATDINPDDIESIQILKGASAAAIYGAKAGNGVIIITTKRGKFTSSDKPARISFSSSIEMDKKTDKIDLQTTFGQRVPYKPYKPGSSDSWTTTPLPAGTPVYDHQEDVFRTAYATENSLTISGGVPQFDYAINGTYLDQQGYVIGSDLSRASVRANIGASILPKLTLQSNTNYIATNNDLPQDGSNTSGILLGSLRTPPEFNNQNYLESDGVTERRFGFYDNPIWTQHFNTYNQKINRILHSTELKWMPIDWLSFTLRYGLDWYAYDYGQRLAVQSASSPSRLGSISYSTISNTQQNLDFTFNLNQSILDGDLTFDLVGGTQSIWYDNTTVGASSTNTLSFFDQIAAGSSKDASSTLTSSEIQGIFGQLTSSYLDKYSLTLGIRRDGSSTFGASQQFHTYPKVGLSYSISKEPFFAGLKDVISNLRIRGSWGEAGSPNLPYPYATNFIYVTTGNFDPWVETSNSNRGGFNGIRSYEVAGATDINPELSIEREIGLDLSFLNDRLSFEFTFYHSDVFDLIMSLPAPPSTGYTNMLQNAGSMWNEGFELGITANPINITDFNWTTQLNYSRNYNLVTSLKAAFYTLTGGFVGAVNSASVGRPLGVFQTYGWLRYDAAKAANAKPGDLDYVSPTEMAAYHYKNGDVRYSYWDASSGQVVGDDYGENLVGAPRQNPNLLFMGNPNPSYMISWRNDFTILDNITFSFLLDGVFGFDVWNGTRGALYNFGTSGDTKDRLDPWVENGHPVMDYSNPANPVQAPKVEKYRTYYNGFNINEPFFEDGSFVKLREVRIDYRWKGLEDWNINSIVFSLSARNLLTITKYKGYNPEVNTFSLAEGRGIDYFTLPQVTSVRFGITINY
jgi:TonB-linked SusC/RagA family outer membrane protein